MSNAASPAVPTRRAVVTRRTVLTAFLLCVLVTNAFAIGSLYLLQRDREIGDSILQTVLALARLERIHRLVVESFTPAAGGSAAEATERYRRRAPEIDRALSDLMHLTSADSTDRQHAVALGATLAQLGRSAAFPQTSPGTSARIQQAAEQIERFRHLASDQLEQRERDKVSTGRNLRITLATMAAICLAMIAILFVRIDRLWAICSRAQIEAEHQAHRDALTGLPNARLLEDRLSMALAHARRMKRKVAVVTAALEGYAEIDESDAAAADSIAREAAARLARLSRDADTVARVSAGEFVIVLSDVRSEPDVGAFAERVVSTLSAPYPVESRQVELSASAGIAVYAGEATSSETLVRMSRSAVQISGDVGGGSAGRERPRVGWHGAEAVE